MLRPLAWRPRAIPASPEAVFAEGEPARVIARAVLLEPERLEGLRAMASADALVLMGPEALLPWADGCIYLARSEHAQLILPTTLEPDVEARWVLQALAGLRLEPPITLLPASGRAFSMARLRHVDAGQLENWLEAKR